MFTAFHAKIGGVRHILKLDFTRRYSNTMCVLAKYFISHSSLICQISKSDLKIDNLISCQKAKTVIIHIPNFALQNSGLHGSLTKISTRIFKQMQGVIITLQEPVTTDFSCQNKFHTNGSQKMH